MTNSIDTPEFRELLENFWRSHKQGNDYGNAARTLITHIDAKIAEAVKERDQRLREIYEVYAGSEGIPQPMTCAEGYLLSLVEQMKNIAMGREP